MGSVNMDSPYGTAGPQVTNDYFKGVDDLDAMNYHYCPPPMQAIPVCPRCGRPWMRMPYHWWGVVPAVVC